jgi:hypothetical protein
MANIVLDKMNTDVLPVIDVDCYGGMLSTVLEDVFVYDCVEVDNLDPKEMGQEEYDSTIELVNEKYDGRDEFYQQVLDDAPEYIQQSFDDYELPIKIIPDTCKWYHPREYNFSSDAIDFSIEIDTDWVASKFAELSSNPDFVSFIKKRYSSYDGFISFMPNTVEDFETLGDPDDSDYWKIVSAIVSYYVEQNPKIAEDATMDLVDYVSCNPTYATFSMNGIY